MSSIARTEFQTDTVAACATDFTARPSAAIKVAFIAPREGSRVQLEGDFANRRRDRDRLTSRGAMKATLKQKNLCRATRNETWVVR